MAETRAAMTEKLETLEERVQDTVTGIQATGKDMLENLQGTITKTTGAVKDTVDEARSTVTGMVENGQETLNDTVSMVKRSFDFTSQMDQHPWRMLSGAVLVGYALGGLATTTVSPHTERQPASASQFQAPISGLWESALDPLKKGLSLVKSAVIDALMSNVREIATQSWPAIAPQVNQALESITAKLDGHPLPSGEQGKKHPREPGHEHREQPPLI